MVKFQERAKGVFDNLIANLLVAGGAGVISWYTANQAIIAGIPRYVAILIGIGVFALVGFTFTAVAFGVSKLRAREQNPKLATKEISAESRTDLIESSPAYIQLQEKYVDVASQLAGKKQQLKEEGRKLLDMTEQKDAVHRVLDESRRKLEGIQWILLVLMEQAQHLPSLVAVEKVVFAGHRLLSDSDYIELKFKIKNHSVYQISIKEVLGHFSYNTEPFEASPVLIGDPVRNLRFWQTKSFTLKQALTHRESLNILNTPSAIAFHRAKIPIQTTPAITEKHDLQIGFTLERNALIEAYPKLEISILSQELKEYCDLTENRRFNVPQHLGSVINIHLEFENPSQRATDIKQYKLTTHENAGPRRTTTAQKGEIRQNPAQGVSGEDQGLALPNLSDRHICAEQREPYDGWLQFFVKTHPQNLHGCVAELTIIDVDGVEHPAKTGALQYKGQRENP